MARRYMVGYAVYVLFCLTVLYALPASISAEIMGGGEGKDLKTATLQECIQMAVENNHLRPASRFAVEMAEAQHRQALAGYWPQISIQGGYQRMDESSNFIFPSSNIDIPMGGSIPMLRSSSGSR